jgi:hypothetical protein
MQYQRKHVIAALLFGIAIGATAGTFYYLGFIEDRADDGLPIRMGDDLYIITQYEQPDPSFLYGNTFNTSIGGVNNEQEK